MVKRLRMDVETETEAKKQKTSDDIIQQKKGDDTDEQNEGDDTIEQKKGDDTDEQNEGDHTLEQNESDDNDIKDDRTADDMTTETTTFEEDDDLETDGVNIMDTNQINRISQTSHDESKAQQLKRVKRAPDVKVVVGEVKDAARKASEDISKGARSKTGVTLHLHETKAPGPRVDNNLNEPETPETDIIYIEKVQNWKLPNPPNQVQNRYADISPNKLPTKKKTTFCGIQFDEQKPDQQTNILIPHKNADKPEGDDFGASLSTYTEHLSDGTTYHRHFFVKVQPDAPASEMKIQDKDEFVLLNDVFVPVLDHTKVLNLFHQVKVDGETRTSLVVRRKRTKEKWEWMETSAVLNGMKQTDYPVATKVQYQKIDGAKEVYRPLSKHRYRVPGNQMFIDIRDGKVQLNVLTRGSNQSTIIWKHAKFWQYDSEGHIDFASTLCDFKQQWYIRIDQHDQIVVSRDPVWFRMIKVGSKIRFQYQKLYLGYDLGSNKLEAQVTDCLFEELPVLSADTADTWEASRIRKIADEVKTNSDIQSHRPPLHINVAMSKNGTNPITNNDVPSSADLGAGGFEYGCSSSSSNENVKRMSSHSSETSGYMSSTPDSAEITTHNETRANFPTHNDEREHLLNKGFPWSSNLCPVGATPTTSMQNLDLSDSDVD